MFSSVSSTTSSRHPIDERLSEVRNRLSELGHALDDSIPLYASPAASIYQHARISHHGVRNQGLREKDVNILVSEAGTAHSTKAVATKNTYRALFTTSDSTPHDCSSIIAAASVRATAPEEAPQRHLYYDPRVRVDSEVDVPAAPGAKRSLPQGESFDIFKAVQERLRNKLKALEVQQQGSTAAAPAFAIPHGANMVPPLGTPDVIAGGGSPPPREPPSPGRMTATPLSGTSPTSPDSPSRGDSCATALPPSANGRGADALLHGHPQQLTLSQGEARSTKLQKDSRVPEKAVRNVAAALCKRRGSIADVQPRRSQSSSPRPSQPNAAAPSSGHIVGTSGKRQYASSARATSASSHRSHPRSLSSSSQVCQPTSKGRQQRQQPVAMWRNATVLESLTGAELLAVLRLRGIIVSSGNANSEEHNMTNEQCHAMYLTPSEFEQLLSLRRTIEMTSTYAPQTARPARGPAVKGSNSPGLLAGAAVGIQSRGSSISRNRQSRPVVNARQ